MRKCSKEITRRTVGWRSSRWLLGRTLPDAIEANALGLLERDTVNITKSPHDIKMESMPYWPIGDRKAWGNGPFRSKASI